MQEQIQEILRNIFSTQPLMVLCTSTEGRPYTNLVAFAHSEDLRQIIFATFSNSQKYRNLSRDNRVSLLIDDRGNTPADFSEATAITALGTACPVPKKASSPLGQIYLKKHPQLQDFLNSPNCQLIRVVIDKYCVVTRFQQVVELCPQNED